MKPRIKTISLVMTFVALCFSMLYIFSRSNGRQRTTENYFGFNPETLMKSLKNGDKDVFVPVQSDMVDDEVKYNKVSWTQADYLQIALAIHELVWRESAKDWRISFISFNLSCNAIDKGSQYAIIDFMKEEITTRGFSAIEHEIHIEPKHGLISAWEYRYDPSIIRLKAVDIGNLSISADQALAIVESKGGSKVRNQTGNNCEISVTLSPGSVKYRGWYVTYSPHLFSMIIDPVSGEEIK